MEQIPKATSKTFFQLSPNKIAITIGYNASDNNQHLSILNAIEAFEPLLKFKDKIEFIIPFTYGGTERYMQAIRERLKRFQFNFKVIELYQPMNQLFHLRNASDVFIHLPLSDSISGSLREYLISKNIVITGNWLPYKILDQNEIYYQSIDHLNKLSEILFKSLSNIEIEQLNCSDNPTKMYKISSWNMVIENWITLYNNLIEDNKYTNLPN